MEVFNRKKIPFFSYYTVIIIIIIIRAVGANFPFLNYKNKATKTKNSVIIREFLTFV